MYLSFWSCGAWGEDKEKTTPLKPAGTEKSEPNIPFYGTLTREQRRDLISRLKKAQENGTEVPRSWGKLYWSFLLDKDRSAAALECAKDLETMRKNNKDPEVDLLIFQSLAFIVEHPDAGEDFEKKLFDEYRNAGNTQKEQLLEALYLTKWDREEQRFKYFLEMYKDEKSSNEVRKAIIGSIHMAGFLGRVRVTTCARWYRELASLPMTSLELAKQIIINLGDILIISDDKCGITKHFQKMREVSESIKHEMVDPEK